jgi:hypothetical protein
VKTRADMLVKYFSERISPAVHDKASLKEGVGVWKEAYSKTLNMSDDPKLKLKL